MGKETTGKELEGTGARRMVGHRARATGGQ